MLRRIYARNRKLLLSHNDNDSDLKKRNNVVDKGRGLPCNSSKNIACAPLCAALNRLATHAIGIFGWQRKEAGCERPMKKSHPTSKNAIPLARLTSRGLNLRQTRMTRDGGRLTPREYSHPSGLGGFYRAEGEVKEEARHYRRRWSSSSSTLSILSVHSSRRA
jgi:hypothetical protein